MAEQSDDDVTAVAAALADVVRKGGTDLASDPKRVRATMSDLLGSGSRTARAHVDAIVLASEEGVPDRLHTDPSCADSLVAQLRTRDLNDEMAAFAVASWRFALGQSRDAPSEPSVHTTSAPATEPTPPSASPHPTDPQSRSGVPTTTFAGPSGQNSDPTATVLPAGPARNRSKRSVLTASILAVLVLGGALTAAITLNSNGDTTDTTDRSGGDAANGGSDRPADREPRALPQPTADELAGADISGVWEDTDTTTSCRKIPNYCDDPGANFPLYLDISIERGQPATSQLRRQIAEIPEGTCVLNLANEIDGNTAAGLELAFDGKAYTANGVLSWSCSHPDGTSEDIYDWTFVAALTPAAMPTDAGWRANHLVGTFAMTDPGAPGGCAQAAASFDISMIRPGELLPDVVFDAIAAKVDELLKSSTGADCAMADADGGFSYLGPPQEPQSGSSEVQMQSFVGLFADSLRRRADGAPPDRKTEAETVRQIAQDLEREGSDAGFSRDWADSLRGFSAKQQSAMSTLVGLLPSDVCRLTDWSSFGGGS